MGSRGKLTAVDSDAIKARPACGVLVRIAYEGTRYAGWAPQNNATAVCDVVLAAIQKVDASVLDLRGVSRTDAGVHAVGQVAAFDAALEIPSRGWVNAINTKLPNDISIRAASRVASGLVPRFVSKKKQYCYSLLLDPVKDPFWESRAWRIKHELNFDEMKRASETICGTHDFAAFRGSSDERTDTVRTIDRVSIDHGSDSRIVRITVEGDRFMYNMVRIIVGTLVDIGSGRLPGALSRALDTKQRGDLGMTAPAHGLCLEKVWLDVQEGECWPERVSA